MTVKLILASLIVVAGCGKHADDKSPLQTPSGAAAVMPTPLADGGLGDGNPMDDALTAMPMAPQYDGGIADARVPMPPADGMTGDAGPLL
jgi:hypothetical protein